MKRIALLFTLCFFAAGILRLSTLEAHWSSDEARWLNRSTQFISAIKKGEFSDTLIVHHPGVTTMWIAGLRTFFVQPRMDVENLANARWFIGIFTWIGTGIACLLLYKLFGRWVALAGFACLAYSPLFLAQTRRVHTDALATTFILLTVLLFLIYCQNKQHLHYLIFSGLTFGLALLSKSYALILLPWIPLSLFLFRDKQAGGLQRYVAIGICFLNAALLTVLSIWPVFWTPRFAFIAFCLLGLTFVLLRAIRKGNSPVWLVAVAGFFLILVCSRIAQTLWIVLDKINWAVTTPHEVEQLFLGKVVSDPGWLFYPLVLSIKSTPLMLPLAFLGCVLLWKHRRNTDAAARHFKAGVALVAGVVLFTFCLSATSKKFDRYLLPAFGMLEILAAVGFVEGLKWGYTALRAHFGAAEPAKYKAALAVTLCIGFFFVQIFPVLARHPYYGTYYNPCWKTTDITKIITVGDGSGLDIAATYMNKNPNARYLRIAVSPLGTEIFQYYFVGFAYHTRKKYLPTDYEIVYLRDSQIQKVPKTGIRNGELEHVITLNGIDHVWIYRTP